MKWNFSILIIMISTAVIFGQGNYNQENFGNRSLLLSGNVTGSVEDLGLTYYNPARIALVENPVFSINAKGYQISIFNITNAFGNDKKLTDNKFEGVPSMVAGTFKIKKLENHHFAYSFLSKQRSQAEIGYSIELSSDDLLDEIDGIESIVQDVDIRNKETDEWFGVTWGKQIKDNFSIGISGFVSIYNNKGSSDLKYAILDEFQDVSQYTNEISFGQRSYGMFWKIGLAWKLPKIELGLNVDLPYWEVISSGRFKFQEQLSGLGNGNDIFTYGKFNDIKATRKEAMAISVGAGIPFGNKNTIHLKLDWHNKIKEYDRLVIPVIDGGTEESRSFIFKEEFNSVFNFGFGLEFYLNPKYSLFASFVTDFSPVEANANIFDLTGDEGQDINLSADYYHLGFGVDMKLNWAKLILGTTFSTGSSEFDQAIDVPDPKINLGNNDDNTKLSISRWRFIVGLEIPIFNYKLEIK